MLEYLIGEDEGLKNRAITKLFFCPKGTMMSPYMKAAQDAIRRKFNGDVYNRYSFDEVYQSAISVELINELCSILKRMKASFEQNQDSISEDAHWTDSFVNFTGFISKFVERYTNNRRLYVNDLLDIKIFEEDHYDDNPNTKSLSDNTDTSKDGGNDASYIAPEDESGELRDEMSSTIRFAVSQLKPKFQDLILKIALGGQSNSEYAKENGLEVNAVNRDFARAKNQLLVILVDEIRKHRKGIVLYHSYMLDDYMKTLLSDIVLKGVSFEEAAKCRNMMVSDIKRDYASSFNIAQKSYLEELGSTLHERELRQNRINVLVKNDRSRKIKLGIIE